MTARVNYFDNPIRALDQHRSDFRIAGADAFGRGEDFYEDVDDHFAGSEWGQVIAHEDEIIGFSLYSSLPRNGVHLEGIAIKKEYQGRGIGHMALHHAVRDRYIEYVTATTRNPATVRLLGGIARVACPDIRLDDPHIHQNNFLVMQASQEALNHLRNVDDKSSLPYLVNRYPEGLYGVDPGANMPLEMIHSNPRNAVIVAAVL